jgi:hypothetical protein
MSFTQFAHWLLSLRAKNVKRKPLRTQFGSWRCGSFSALPKLLSIAIWIKQKESMTLFSILLGS